MPYVCREMSEQLGGDRGAAPREGAVPVLLPSHVPQLNRAAARVLLELLRKHEQQRGEEEMEDERDEPSKRVTTWDELWALAEEVVGDIHARRENALIQWRADGGACRVRTADLPIDHTSRDFYHAGWEEFALEFSREVTRLLGEMGWYVRGAWRYPPREGGRTRS